jgi:hypothetical protein
MAEAKVFMVRVWQWRGSFHATLRAPGAEEALSFSDPMDVGDYLRRASAGPLPARAVEPPAGAPEVPAADPGTARAEARS